MFIWLISFTRPTICVSHVSPAFSFIDFVIMLIYFDKNVSYFSLISIADYTNNNTAINKFISPRALAMCVMG